MNRSKPGATHRMGRREMFLLLDTALQAVAPRGTAKCRKRMAAIDQALRTPSPARRLSALSSATAGDAINTEGHVMLAARCAICPRRCEEPIL